MQRQYIITTLRNRKEREKSSPGETFLDQDAIAEHIVNAQAENGFRLQELVPDNGRIHLVLVRELEQAEPNLGHRGGWKLPWR